MLSLASRITPESRPATLETLYFYRKVAELSNRLLANFADNARQCPSVRFEVKVS
jgi:hypothetical protein